MATSSTYCTHRDLKDIYPNIDEFDTKVPLYGWVSDASNYVLYNSGLVTDLFIDSKTQESGKQTIGTVALTTANDADITKADGTITVTDGATITDDTYIKIDDEIILVTDIAGHDLTVTRGHFGTTATTHANGASVYQHFNPSSSGNWIYDSDNDFIILKYGSDPSNLLTESGEDFSTLITRIMSNASRYLDSRIDAKLPRDQWKDKSGNFDYMIVRTSAVISVIFLLQTVDNENPTINQFWQEANFNIEQLNSGKVKLSNQASGDSALGILRDVLVGTNSTIRPVDTRGSYQGIYDLLKIKITDVSTNGANIGKALFSVWQKDSDGLKNNKIIENEKVTGDYQTIGNGMQIRFSAPEIDGTKDVATLNDEWELECWGSQEAMLEGSSVVGYTAMTRR